MDIEKDIQNQKEADKKSFSYFFSEENKENRKEIILEASRRAIEEQRKIWKP